MKTLKTVTLILCGLALAVPAWSASPHAGSVDFSAIEVPDGVGKVTVVNLDPAILGAAARSSTNGDAELTEILSELESIQVKAFELEPGDRERLLPVIERINSQLAYEGWHELVRTRKGNEQTVVAVLMQDTRMAGLLVMALEEDEAAFVNVVGTLDLGSIVQLADKLDELDLEELSELAGKADED